MGAARQGALWLRVVTRVMLDRRRMPIWILVVIVVMIALQMRLDQFCVTRIRPTRSADVRPSEADLWEERAMERVVLETRPIVNCYHDSEDADEEGAVSPYLHGSFMLPNHTTTPIAPEYAFDPEGERDVLVFLHIQKTGGTTFGRHLVSNLELRTPCRCHQDRKKCDCRNSRDKIWTVSRYSTGWRCGLHADWTELTHCVDRMLDKVEGTHRNRRYLYITILRDPYARYVSEFKHVQRGATWKAARLQCDGRQASLEEVPFCFEGSNWTGVTLEAFMSCPHNLANNRQVRMLANLSLSGCYKNGAMSPEARDCTMLRSAKHNLRHLAFFGLTEYQQETQYLFERTFGLRFRQNFFQYNHTHASDEGIPATHRAQILGLNKLDVSLYNYAKALFFERIRKLLDEDAVLRTAVLDYGGAVQSRHPADGAAPPRGDDYEEGDENDAEDDDEYNHRIAGSKRTERRDRPVVFG